MKPWISLMLALAAAGSQPATGATLDGQAQQTQPEAAAVQDLTQAEDHAHEVRMTMGPSSREN
jgi:hypothetical protein